MSSKKEANSILCTVCQSADHEHFITTSSMMHSNAAKQFHFQKCGVCNSVFLSNPVSESELFQYYEENYLPYQGAKAWGKFAPFVQKSQKKLDARRVAVVKNAVKNHSGKFSLLDVGCGRPSFLKQAQQKLQADCSGIDFTNNGWNEGSYEHLKLSQTSLAEFESHQKYDIITLWHYLEHDYQLQDTAQKLHHFLKPGGKLIIEVPDYDSLTAKRQKQFWQGWHSPRHLTLFSSQGFSFLFSKEKWTTIHHHRYGTLDAFTLWWLGYMEKHGANWSTSMEKEFWPLVVKKVISFPIFMLEKIIPMGIQLIVIEKNLKSKSF